jgi:hypothetical protein
MTTSTRSAGIAVIWVTAVAILVARRVVDTFSKVISPRNGAGSLGAGRSGITVSASQTAVTRWKPTDTVAIVLVICARSRAGWKKRARYARKTESEPIVIAVDKTSSDPRQRTRPVQTATARVTEGDISADTRRACSDAVTISLLTFCNCCSWRSSPSNALLTRSAKAASSGVTASAMKAKSQRNKNITTIMPTNDSTSVRMFSVDVDAKLWIV